MEAFFVCTLKVPVSTILIQRCKGTYQQEICNTLQNGNQTCVLALYCKLSLKHESKTS